MQLVLVDVPVIWANLRPLTLTRPVSHVRVGIFTLVEKWENYAQHLTTRPPGYKTAHYLEKKFFLPDNDAAEKLYVNSAVCPTPELWQSIMQLKAKESLFFEDTFLAYRDKGSAFNFAGLIDSINNPDSITIAPTRQRDAKTKEFVGDFTYIQTLTDIFAYNGKEIQADFRWISSQRTSQPIEDKHTIVYNPENVFIEDGAQIKAAILDASKGVIYIGKNAEVQAGTVIQGNFALCEGAVVNVGGKMRPDTTIGVHCKVGGEISNSVLFGYSNKAHDGFLGNSVLGEWCNLGADTNTSNLKNNYSNVRIWNYKKADFIDTGRQFCGLLMGDHSKAGINTMFNTGTVVGVSANVFGGDFPPKYIPSFSWGGSEYAPPFELDKAFEVAQRVMERRGKRLTEAEKEILKKIFLER